MSYAAAIDRLHALGQELHTPAGAPRRKFELAHMRTLMAALGDPQNRFASVLVAGTNGKGSTAATLASILTEAGYRTGLYTSPHLIRVNERIRIGREAIEDDAFAHLFMRVERAAAGLVQEGKLPGAPSFFETLTAIAFLAFAELNVTVAVLEVGMGGRLDATNIVEPLVSVITDISLDHTEWLGSTIAQIAREKAGILRRDGVLITLPQHPEANQALGEAAVALNVRGVNAAAYVPSRVEAIAESRNHYMLRVEGETLEVDSPLAGAHQQRNLALAIATAGDLRHSYGYNISTRDIAAGIRATEWPGRLETLSVAGADGAAREVVLDVGHNPAGAWALRAALSRLDEEAGRPMVLVFGCLRDKPAGELAQILFPLFECVILTPLDSPRSASLDDLRAAARPTGSPVETAPDPVAAFTRALEVAPPGGRIVVTGSVLLVGKVREHLAAQRVLHDASGMVAAETLRA